MATPTNIEAVIGTIRGVRLREKGLFGNLHLLKSHPMAERLLESAESQPNLFGLSHNAVGIMNDRGDLVEEIQSVRSVDLVSSPATTTGLFESHRGSEYDRLKQLYESEEGIGNFAADFIGSPSGDQAGTFGGPTRNQNIKDFWKSFGEIEKNKDLDYRQIKEKILDALDALERSMIQNEPFSDLPESYRAGYSTPLTESRVETTGYPDSYEELRALRQSFFNTQ